MTIDLQINYTNSPKPWTSLPLLASTPPPLFPFPSWDPAPLPHLSPPTYNPSRRSRTPKEPAVRTHGRRYDCLGDSFRLVQLTVSFGERSRRTWGGMESSTTSHLGSGERTVALSRSKTVSLLWLCSGLYLTTATGGEWRGSETVLQCVGLILGSWGNGCGKD